MRVVYDVAEAHKALVRIPATTSDGEEITVSRPGFLVQLVPHKSAHPEAGSVKLVFVREQIDYAAKLFEAGKSVSADFREYVEEESNDADPAA